MLPSADVQLSGSSCTGSYRGAPSDRTPLRDKLCVVAGPELASFPLLEGILCQLIITGMAVGSGLERVQCDRERATLLWRGSMMGTQGMASSLRAVISRSPSEGTPEGLVART